MMTFLEMVLIHQKKALSSIGECLKSVISKGKTYLLVSKWTQEKLCKISDETINKTYTEYKQRKLNKKGEKTGKPLGKHVLNLYSTRISRVVKVSDVKKLQKDIENDLIIRDQMANFGWLLVCTFGNFLAPVLVALHTVNNLDLGDEQCPENDGYESD